MYFNLQQHGQHANTFSPCFLVNSLLFSCEIRPLLSETSRLRYAVETETGIRYFVQCQKNYKCLDEHQHEHFTAVWSTRPKYSVVSSSNSLTISKINITLFYLNNDGLCHNNAIVSIMLVFTVPNYMHYTTHSSCVIVMLQGTDE